MINNKSYIREGIFFPLTFHNDMQFLGSLVGGLFGLGSAGMQYGMQSKLMDKQHSYNKELQDISQQYNRENMATTFGYNKFMAENSAGIAANSMRKAGQSIAGLGDSFSPISSGVSNPAGPSASVGLGSAGMPDLVSGIGALMNLKKLKSEIDLNNSLSNKNNTDADKTRKDIAWIDELNNANVKYLYTSTEKNKQELENLKVDIQKSISEIHVNEENKKVLQQQCDKLLAETNSLKINTQYLAELNESRIREIQSNIYKNLQDGNLTEIRADFARMGIGVSSSWIESLVAISSGNAPELANKVTGNIEGLLKQSFDKLPLDSKQKGLFTLFLSMLFKPFNQNN